MTRLQTQAEANAYWENVEFKKWVVTFTAGSSRSRRTTESLVTSRTSTGARKAAIRHQQIERGNDWVASAASTVRLATAQDLGCVQATPPESATEKAGLQASSMHLTLQLSRLSDIATRAVAAMKALHDAASQIDESQGDFDARVPYLAFTEFTDEHARLAAALRDGASS